MSDEEKDDQVIALAFRRSVYVALAVLLTTGLIWLVVSSLPEQEAAHESAEVILPRSTANDKQPLPPVVRFTDITDESGIDHLHQNGAYGERLLPETMGGGVAALDFNNDQAIDLFFVSGTSWPWRAKAAQASSLVLYQGDGRGGFKNVTSGALAESSLYGMGAAVGDYDNDGKVDLFVTAVGENRLYRNTGNGDFEEVSQLAGVTGASDAWSTAAAFTDFDNDGDLDLAVLNYVRWSREIDLQADYKLTGVGRAYGPPAQFAGTDAYLYRNEGNGTFTDISLVAGIQVKNSATGLPIGKGLGILPTDIDRDGWVDLVVANDMVRNFLFRNLDGQGFEEIGEEAGIAFDNTGSATGAMGIDGVEFFDTSDSAIAIGNFGNEMTSLYVQVPRQSLFTDQAIVSGIGPASRRAVTFGLFFFDYDLDGHQDLLQANGHIEPEINIVEPGLSYAQQPQLFWNCGSECSRQFVTVALNDNNDLSRPIVGRGAAYADIDQDGDQDIVLTQIGAPPKLFRNDQLTSNNWIQVEVLNQKGAPAVGAEVKLTLANSMQRRRVETARSYLSQVEHTLSFGLGKSSQITSLEVSMPNRQPILIENPEINKRHTIRLN